MDDLHVNPIKPATAKGEATRQRLFVAAEAEIGEHGFHGASVSGITTRAGVGQGTFYLYFRSKEDVLRGLVDHMGKELRHALTEAINDIENRLDAERAGIEAFVKFVQMRPNLYRVVMESQFVDPDIYNRYYQNFSSGYIKSLEEAEKRGEVRPGNAEARAWALMGIGHFIGLRYPIWEGVTPPDEIMTAVADFIAHGMAP